MCFVNSQDWPVIQLVVSYLTDFRKMYTINQLHHISSCLMYTFTTYRGFLITIPLLKPPLGNFDPGQLKFLTVWNLIIQAIFFFICILNDWFGTNAVSPKKPPFIRKLKDHVHAILGFPIAMFVGIIFWTLMFVDRELVLPKALDPYFPWWLNHLMHTMIMVSTLIEMIIAPRKYPRKSFGLLCLLSFMFIYLIWVHIIFYKSGIWVYPILDVLPLPLRIVFFIVMLLIAVFLYLIGEAVDNFLWGNEYTKNKKSYAKSK